MSLNSSYYCLSFRHHNSCTHTQTYRNPIWDSGTLLQSCFKNSVSPVDNLGWSAKSVVGLPLHASHVRVNEFLVSNTVASPNNVIFSQSSMKDKFFPLRS